MNRKLERILNELHESQRLSYPDLEIKSQLKNQEGLVKTGISDFDDFIELAGGGTISWGAKVLTLHYALKRNVNEIFSSTTFPHTYQEYEQAYIFASSVEAIYLGVQLASAHQGMIFFYQCEGHGVGSDSLYLYNNIWELLSDCQNTLKSKGMGPVVAPRNTGPNKPEILSPIPLRVD